jgi:asparagine synthase (glutamine-hydrolysing)
VLDCLREPVSKDFLRLDYCVEGVQEILTGVVKRQMIADVPVGAFLSGGLDSSLIVALMCSGGNTGPAIDRLHDGKNDRIMGPGRCPGKTFNVSFEDSPGHDERIWARRVAKLFGTEHHEIVITERDAADFFERMVDQLDEPLADPVCIPFYFLSKAARAAGVPVVQVGEGADELFFGYRLYQRSRQAERWLGGLRRVLPGSMRRGIHRMVSPLLNEFRREWLFNWAHDRPLFWGGATAFGQQEKRALGVTDTWEPDEIVEKICAITGPGAQPLADSVSVVNYHLDQLCGVVKQPEFALRLMYLELSQRLPELLLMRADKMSMAEGIEVRVPFLYHRLVEFALKIPESVKCGFETKRVLKQAALRWLPRDVVYREKVGFGVPLERWNASGTVLPAVLAPYREGCNWSSLPDRYSMALRSWVLCQCQAIRGR